MMVLPSAVSQRGRNWRISSDEITIDTARVVVNDFTVRADNQMLHIDGVVAQPPDSLTLRLNNFDIAPPWPGSPWAWDTTSRALATVPPR